MEQSETIGKLAEALSKVQAVLEGAKKDSQNPFYRSAYADLTSVWDACRKPLADNGLSVIQTCSSDVPEVVIVETMLAHSSGEWVRGKVAMKPVKNDPQGVGSCITYARRYSLAAIVGVAPEDDDGNAASQPSNKMEKKPAAKIEPDVPLEVAEPNLTNFQTATRYIKDVTDKKGNTKGKPWTLYFVNDEDGGSYATFNADLADIASDCGRRHILVKITYQAKEKGNNLISLMPEGIE
uniref:Putative Erf family protein n=1 Tax=viral metagenome TaxID=1070528 RepID=A0A6M3LYV7_9ZZZZ